MEQNRIRTREEKFGIISYDSKLDKFTLTPNRFFVEQFEAGFKSYPQELSAPLTMHWVTTLRCNARCSYCYLLPVLKKVSDDEEILSEDEAKRFIEDFAKAGGFRLYLTGGEPTLHPFVDKIMYYAYENGVKTVVNTNGIFIPEPVFQAARDTQSTLSFSLDSYLREEHDRVRKQKSYDSIVEALRRCSHEGIDSRVITVANKSDVLFFEEFGKMLSSLGVSRWFIQAKNGIEIVKGIDSSLEEKLNEEIPNMRIRVLPAIYDSFLYILPDGTACSDSWNGRITYGKVPQNTIKDIWDKNERKTIDDHLGIIHIHNNGGTK